MKLAFEPVWPWPLLFLVAAVLLGAVMAGYPRRIQNLPAGWRRTLLGLRLALIFLMMLWLLRPVAVLETDDRSDATVYVVLDRSSSMSTPDAPGGLTRHQSMRKLFEKAKEHLDEIGETLDVRLVELAEDLLPVDSPTETADGRLTAIGLALEELGRKATREKIVAILLWSDGKQAAMGDNNIDPIQAARLLGRQHKPVYPTPFGTSEVASNTMDISVSELDVPRDVFDGNIVPVRVRFRAFGAEGQDVKVRVLLESRRDVAPGTSGEMIAVPPDVDNRTLVIQRPETQSEDLTLDLQFVPNESGEIKIAVEAEPLNGETRKTNNRVETIIRVRSGGIRIAYFDRVRPELKWLKRINVSSRVRLDVLPILGGKFANRNEFNDEWFQPDVYDAFIIGDVPAEFFGEARIRELYSCCERGAGLMMIGGESSFGAGGYHRTPLAELLPIVMSESDQQLTDDIPMIPRRDTLNIMQIAPPDQNQARWAELPPLKGANFFRLKEGIAAQVLAETRTEMPLLVSQNRGAGRVLVFAGDTTWQWALHDDWAEHAHQRFWRQVIFWLTKMDDDSESPAWINVEPRDLNPGGLASLSFGLRDADGAPETDAKFLVSVTRPDEEVDTVPVRMENSDGAGDFSDTATPGDYWVRLSATDKTGLNNIAMTRFLVNHRDPELDHPAADPALLREIAHVSGGDFLEPNEILERLEEWATSGMPSLQIKRSQRLSLWDNWANLILFVLLLCVEWAVRKKRGLV